MVYISEANKIYDIDAFWARSIDQQIFLQIFLYGFLFKAHRTLVILAKTSVLFAVLAVYWYLILTYIVGWYESSVHLLASVGSIFLNAQGKQGGVLENIFS